MGGNIDELVELIATTGIQKHNQDEDVIVSTLGEGVVSNCTGMEYDHLSPCTQEEAYSRIMLHVADMVRNNMTRIHVRTVNTDVVVICVAHFHHIPGLEELWIAFGRGKQFRYIPVHTIARHLRAEKMQSTTWFPCSDWL